MQTWTKLPSNNPSFGCGWWNYINIKRLRLLIKRSGPRRVLLMGRPLDFKRALFQNSFLETIWQFLSYSQISWDLYQSENLMPFLKSLCFIDQSVSIRNNTCNPKSVFIHMICPCELGCRKVMQRCTQIVASLGFQRL